MKYFFYNPKTKQSEGPYSIDMLRELVSKEQLLPESKLCPPGGKKWIDAAEIGELFSPATIPNISEENDDFVHPLSKKGIKLQEKGFFYQSGTKSITGGVMAIIFSIFYIVMMNKLMSFFGGFAKTKISYTIPIIFIVFGLIFICIGVYEFKKGKSINPDK